MHGGKQEGGRRAGTENVAIIAAMMAALEVREKQMARNEHLLRKSWLETFEHEFLRTLPGATIVGASKPRLWNTVSAIMPDGDKKHQWVVRLDKAAFAVSTGSACITGKEKPSHVLSAMGVKPAQAVRSVRFSAGWETTEQNWHALASALGKIHISLVRARRANCENGTLVRRATLRISLARLSQLAGMRRENA